MIVSIDREEREAGEHFRFLAYCISNGTPRHLEEAGKYLDLLAADSKSVYDLVMTMLEIRYGISWQAIRDSR